MKRCGKSQGTEDFSLVISHFSFVIEFRKMTNEK